MGGRHGNGGVLGKKITNKIHNCDLTSIKGIECFEGILGNDILCNGVEIIQLIPLCGF